MMKCLLVTPYLQGKGGVETVNLVMKQTFEELGYTVSFLTSDECTNVFINLLAKVFGRQIITAYKFSKMSEEFDFTICNGEFGFGVNGEEILCLHHGSYFGYGNALRNNRSFKQALIHIRGAFFQKKASIGKRNFAVSRFVRDLLIKQGVSVEGVIPNCVDTEFFENKKCHRNGIGLYVGSLNYWAKGLDVLNELVDNYGLDIDYASPEESVEIKGKYIGAFDNNEMPDVYARYSYLLLPSRFEGMSMAVLEAMSCGTPVIISNVGQGCEIQEYCSDFVCEGYGADEYYSKVNKILGDWDRYSCKAMNFVVNAHSISDFKQRWMQVLSTNEKENEN